MPIQILTGDDLDRLPSAADRWLWHNYLAAGMIALMTSRWKSGKTTLLSVLLAKLAAGGELAGAAVSAGRAVVVSEEPAGLWADRRQRLGLGPHVQWVCRPFRGRPSHAEWVELIDHLATASADLIVIDPLAMVLPAAAENHAGNLLTVLVELHRLTDRGQAVLLLHHPRKTDSADELSPRGSGALTGFADILIELDRVPGSPTADRRRRLRAVSRLIAPPPRTIELTADGTDYTQPAESATDDFAVGWPILKMVLEDAVERLTRQRILKQWPADYDKPSPATLWRWLDRGCSAGQIECHGSGRRHDPFRYQLVGKTNLLPDLPLLEPLRALEWEEGEMIREADRRAAELQAGMRRGRNR